jgi:hypothetical protein
MGNGLQRTSRRRVELPPPRTRLAIEAGYSAERFDASWCDKKTRKATILVALRVGETD